MWKGGISKDAEHPDALPALEAKGSGCGRIEDCKMQSVECRMTVPS
jgi:hypothetical protein